MKTKIIIKKLSNVFILFFIFLSLLSCHPVEVLDDVIFDNNLLAKISINAEYKNINEVYEISYIEPYIDYSLKTPPLVRINSWLDQNINVFGSQNILTIKIINASLTRIEIENKSKKKYLEKNEFLYEIHFLLKFLLHDDYDQILATTEIEAKRSTTSSKFISLYEKEMIIDTLILDALIDVSLKSEELLKKHMFEYML